MYASHIINTNHVCRTVGDSKIKKRSNSDFGDVKSRFGCVPLHLSHTQTLIMYFLQTYPDILRISQVHSPQHKISAQCHGQDSKLL